MKETQKSFQDGVCETCKCPYGCKGLFHEVGSFTPYALNSNIWVTPTGLIVEQSWLQGTKMCISGLIPTGPSVLE